MSIGAGIYDVNAQQTLVAAFFPLLYWNGRSDSLWSQAIAVNESAFSMNGTRLQTFWRIVNSYADRYTPVFGPLPSADTLATIPIPPPPTPAMPTPTNVTTNDQVNRVFVNFGKAIAAYEYTLATQYALASHDAPFDRFVRDGPGSGWISPQAENGARLFVSKASCLDCHNTPLFSDGRFHDIGVPQAGDHVPTVEDCATTPSKCDCTPGHEKSTCLPSGAWAGALKLAANTFRRDSRWSDDAPDGGPPDGGPPEPDGGARCATTQIDVAPTCNVEPDPTLKGAWRTPSLRDVAITAPYMHDGYYQTLTDVVQHYNMGGVAGAANAFQLPLCGRGDAGRSPCMDAGAPAPHLAVQIKPLGLTDDEVADLVAFLETLTGTAAVAQRCWRSATDRRRRRAKLAYRWTRALRNERPRPQRWRRWVLPPLLVLAASPPRARAAPRRRHSGARLRHGGRRRRRARRRDGGPSPAHGGARDAPRSRRSGSPRCGAPSSASAATSTSASSCRRGPASASSRTRGRTVTSRRMPIGTPGSSWAICWRPR